MSSSSLELLTIDQNLRLQLSAILEEFESYRVGNDLSKKVKEVLPDLTEEVKTKKRKPSLLKRLFLTEYA